MNERDDSLALKASNQVILHEDKVYHQSISQVFNDEVEFVQFDEEATLDEPLFEVAEKVPEIATKEPPTVNFRREFQNELLKFPELTRNIALVGHSGHGKTVFADIFIKDTHPLAQDYYTNSHYLETTRGLTLSTKVINLVSQDSRGKSYSLNLVDTPGHVDFWDELAIGIKLADVVLLMIDVCEPIMPTAVKAIEHALAANKRLLLCVNKLDRLMIDQQRSAQDIASRIFFIIDEVNSIVKSIGARALDPSKNEVLFASATYGWCFSFATIGHQYSMYAHNDKILANLKRPSVFAKYALEPLIKLCYATATRDRQLIKQVLSKLDIRLKEADFGLPMPLMIRKVFQKYFVHPNTALLDAIMPPESGSLDSAAMHIVKLVHFEGKLYGLAKILSGVFSVGQTVIGPNQERKAQIDGIFLPHVHYNTQTESAYPGNIVLIGGVGNLVRKCGTLYPETANTCTKESGYNLTFPVIKVGVEPFHTLELRKLVDGLQLLERTWPGIKVKVECTGEHLVYGPGELFLDCALYALRHDYAKVDIKVTDPSTQFRETVVDDSYAMCTTSTPNGANKIAFLASPFPEEAWSDLKSKPSGEPRYDKLSEHGWDSLAVASIITAEKSNILVNESSASMVGLIKDDILQGFREYSTEGPLCNEPVRNMQLKLTECEIAEKISDRSSGQLTPTIRRACCSAQLVASPRLLEPIWRAVVIGPLKVGASVYKLLAARRGRVISDTPVPGTNLFTIVGEIPVLDAFGFETEVMGHCYGNVRVNCTFSHWAQVPGDPLDENQNTHKLECAGPAALARDIVCKVRKRKGLSREPALRTYLDADVAEMLRIS